MKRSKRLAALFLPILLLSSCAQKQAVDSSLTLLEMSEAIINSQSELPVLASTLSGEDDFSFYLSNYYRLDSEQIESGVIRYADGVEASEIAILVLTDESAVNSARDALTAYIENRAGDFAGYAPAQAALAENGIAVVNGRYAALLICADTEAARSAFLNCFASDSAPGNSSSPRLETSSQSIEQTSTDLSYDAQSVLDAWRSGETGDLSDADSTILQAASEVIDQTITAGMTDYEKELAIHDWITGWSSFDMGAFSHAPGSGEGSDSDTPYGVLINKRGNCWGYSSTFQLFMDMLDIECITVYGLPRSSGAEHAWNQVCLDGEWYCVDTAWDDPIGGSPGHTYFNVTTERLRNSGIHQWDETDVPEAVGTKYSYGS